jgi:hypothetical protein
MTLCACLVPVPGSNTFLRPPKIPEGLVLVSSDFEDRLSSLNSSSPGLETPETQPILSLTVEMNDSKWMTPGSPDCSVRLTPPGGLSAAVRMPCVNIYTCGICGYLPMLLLPLNHSGFALGNRLHLWTSTTFHQAAVCLAVSETSLE